MKSYKRKLTSTLNTLRIIMFNGVCVDVENLEKYQTYKINDHDVSIDDFHYEDNAIIIHVKGGVIENVENLKPYQDYEVIEQKDI